MVAIAGGMRGATLDAVLSALRVENRLCRPPLSEVELRSAAHSVGRYDDDVLIGEPGTDAGNARVFAAAHGHHLRYVAERRAWYAFIDGLWRPDGTGHAERAAKDVARERLRAAGEVSDSEARKRLTAWALKSQNGPQQRELLKLAQSEPGIALRAEKLDRDPMLLTCANGTLDLRTGRLRDHDPADLISRGSPVVFDKSAQAPRWRRFLDEVFGGDDELVAFVQRAVGYSLTGDMREQVMFVCFGDGANGKSVFLDAVAVVLGDLAGTSRFSETFGVMGSKTGPRSDLVALVGKRMARTSEGPKGVAFDEELVKTITGGDPISTAEKYGKQFTFSPQFKVWMATNERPPIDAGNKAMWRRMRLVPFAVSFIGREDHMLDATLNTELPGILRWAVDGCMAWGSDGLGTAAAVMQATEEYRESQDVIGQFLADRLHRCEDHAGICQKMKAKTLYAVYEAFCQDVGERPVPAQTLTKDLRARWPEVETIRSNGERSIVGASLDPMPEAF